MSATPSVLDKIVQPLRQGARHFRGENTALAALNKAGKAQITSAPAQLAEGVWLDFQMDAGVEAEVRINDGRFVIDVPDRGRARWFALYYKIDLETLRQGRYLGLLVAQNSPGFTCYRPALRLIRPDGSFRDTFTREYMVSSGGEDEQLCFIKLDREKLEGATESEVHLFFEGSAFTAEFAAIENFLVV